MSSAALFFIGLIAAFQVGDCAVTFSDPATASHTISPGLAEGANAAASIVYTVTAASAPAAVTYSLTVGSFYFGIDTSSGAISNTAVLDYETGSTYLIVVLGTDNASPVTSASVSITVPVTAVATDPYFPAIAYCAILSDETASGTAVTTIAATDPDSDTLTYSISAASNTNTDFAISAAGVITTANKLYRQQTQTYTLVIYAADSTLSGTATLSVCVGSSTYCTACSSSGTAAMTASILLTLFALLHVL